MPSGLTRLRANTQLAALTQPGWLSVLSRAKMAEPEHGPVHGPRLQPNA